MEATIKEEWPVKQWNPHDDFMFIILFSCLRFLGRHCPPHLFEYDRCLRAAQGNINLQMMLHFVYDCGLPYLILRNSIRKHPNAEIRKQILLVYNVCMPGACICAVRTRVISSSTPSYVCRGCGHTTT